MLANHSVKSVIGNANRDCDGVKSTQLRGGSFLHFHNPYSANISMKILVNFSENRNTLIIYAHYMDILFQLSTDARCTTPNPSGFQTTVSPHPLQLCRLTGLG